MKILDVLYYYYYLIYTKVIPDEEPNVTTIFCLGFSFGYPLFCVVNFILAFFCLETDLFLYITIIASPMLVLYLLYWKTARYKIVIRKKPMFLNSHIKTKIIVGIFFFISVSFMFWGAPLAKFIDEQIGCEQRVPVEQIIVKWIVGFFQQ